MVLITKWGCDGSQQSQFKQKFENNTGIDGNANIYQSSFVLLRLIIIIDNEHKKIIWQNSVPSSVRFCWSIHIRFNKESKDITNEEKIYIEDQVKSLKETEFNNLGG